MNLQQRLTKGCKGCPFFVTLSGSHLPEFSRAKDDQSCLPKSGVFCNHFFSFLKPRSRTVLAKWGELNTHRNFETSCRVRCGKERNCFCMSFFSWLLLIVKTCQNNMQRKHLWQLRGWLRGEITGVTADRTCQYGPTACQSPQARAWFPPQATEVLGAVWRSFGAPKRSKCSLVLLAPCVFRFKNSLPPALNSPLIRQYTLDNIEWIYLQRTGTCLARKKRLVIGISTASAKWDLSCPVGSKNVQYSWLVPPGTMSSTGSVFALKSSPDLIMALVPMVG